MSLSLLVFDWDQTLWDSWEVHWRAIDHAAQGIGATTPTEREIVASFSSRLEEQLGKLFGQSLDGATQRYLDFYQRNSVLLSRAFPEVKEVLEELLSRGHKLAILSNKRRVEVARELQHSGLAELFAHSVFRDDVDKLKPEPDGLLSILHAHRIPPSEALFIGDTATDIEAAKRGGVASVAALWGALDAPSLLAQGPDHIWSHIGEALQLGIPLSGPERPDTVP